MFLAALSIHAHACARSKNGPAACLVGVSLIDLSKFELDSLGDKEDRQREPKSGRHAIGLENCKTWSKLGSDKVFPFATLIQQHQHRSTNDDAKWASLTGQMLKVHEVADTSTNGQPQWAMA